MATENENQSKINIVLMNVAIPSKNGKKKNTTKQGDWEKSLTEYLSTFKENYIDFIFFQEGDSKKSEFLKSKTKLLGEKIVEEGNGKTNGIIHKKENTITSLKTKEGRKLVIQLEMDQPCFFMLDSHRFSMALYEPGSDKRRVLIVSYHAFNIAKGLTDQKKIANTEYYLEFFDQVRKYHECESMIVAGDFNIEYEKIKEKCEILLEKLDLTVMEYTLEDNHHRAQNSGEKAGRRKEKVDTIIHTRVIQIVKDTLNVDKNIPPNVMDHHAIAVTLSVFPTSPSVRISDEE